MKKTLLLIGLGLLLSSLNSSFTVVRAQCHSNITSIPWKETFAGGDDCWYKPSGSRWNDVIPYNNPSLEHMRYLYLQMQGDQQGSWIISKGIQIPADTSVHPRLYWKVASNTSSYALHYGVLVTTSTNYTDTANYTEIYYDHTTHQQWSNYEQLSVSLEQYVGQTIHIAFHNHPNMAPWDDRCVCIDDVEVRGEMLPVVSLEAPNFARVGRPVRLEAILESGSLMALNFSWHSTLLGTTWTTTADSTYISYNTVGTDTLTVVVSNVYGTDSAAAVIEVVDCGAMLLPYTEDFTGVTATAAGMSGSLPSCWFSGWNGSNAAYAPHVITTNGYSWLTIPNNALFLVAGTSNGYGTRAEVVLPPFAAGLQSLSVVFDYMFEMVDRGNLEVGYYDVNGNYSAVRTITPHANSYRRDTVSFVMVGVSDGLIAFRWSCSNSYYAVAIDNVEVYVSDLSALLILGLSTVTAYDSVGFSTRMRDGDSAVTSYIWHSTLMDSTVSLPTSRFSLVYDRVGVDTITVVVVSAAGNDTASKVVNVIGLPIVSIQGLSTIRTGDNVSFSALFIGGVDTATTYSWHSTLMDTTTLNSRLSTFDIVYDTTGVDTLTVTVTTLLGSTTVSKEVTVFGCPDATLPWKETFADGDDCWYKPEGCRWKDVIPYNDPSLEHMRYLYLQMQGDQQGSWIISKGIQIPADTGVHPRLYWKVASNTSSYALHYGVLVTTSTNYTDTANYTEIYYDHTTHQQWSNYEQLSVSLEQYAGQTIHIAFHNHPNMAPWDDRCVCIDDVEVRGQMAPVVSLHAPDNVTSGHQVQLIASLIEGSGMGLSYIWHSTLMDTTVSGPQLSTLNFVYDFGGIDTVTVVVSNVYGADTVSKVIEVFDCRPRMLPYTEDFEGVPSSYYSVAGQIPSCWIGSSNGSNAAYAPHVIAPGDYPHVTIPNHALFMIAGTNTYGNQAMLTLPSFTDSLNNLFFAFDYCYENNNHGTLEVGYCNHNSIFTPVQTITPHANNYCRDTVSFASVGVTDGFIALRWSNGSVYFGVAIDNIEVFNNLAVVVPDTVWRTVTVVSADATMGNDSGSGRYVDSSLVTLTATPLEGYHFERWNDYDTHAVRQVMVTSDTLFIAYFAQDTVVVPDTVWHTVMVITNAASACEPYGSGRYVHGDTVEIGYRVSDTTSGGGHWEFIGWNDGLSDNPRAVVVTSDTAFALFFRWVEDSVGIEEIQNSELKIEIYPNPAHGDVTVSVNEQATLTVIDMTGRTVVPPTPIDSSSNFRLSTSKLSSGAYFVRVAVSNSFVVRKLIVK